MKTHLLGALALTLATSLTACGVETATTAATTAKLQAQQAEQAKQQMDQIQQKMKDNEQLEAQRRQQLEAAAQ